MLDANSVIHLFSGVYPTLTERIGQCEAGSVVISSIVLAEVALGGASGLPPSTSLVDRFIAEILVVDFDEKAARAYAALPFKRGSFDRLIAAHALSLGLTVITRNVSDYVDVAALRVEDWTI
jgi:tRNA(fMet)-specific endonuclease VapC